MSEAEQDPRRYSQGGFTLLEVVLALAILSAMMGIGYSLTRNVIRVKFTLDDKRDGMYIANSVINRLSRELMLTLGDKPLLPPPSEVPPGGAAATGTPPPKSSAPQIMFLGETKSSPLGTRGDSITFVALEAGQYIPDGGTHSGVVQITYRVEEDPEQRGNRERTLLLVRDEIPYRQPSEKAYKNALRFPITNSLIALEFMYFDKKSREWVSSWEQDRIGRRPDAIQFSITLASPSGRRETYTSVITVTSKKE